VETDLLDDGIESRSNEREALTARRSIPSCNGARVKHVLQSHVRCS